MISRLETAARWVEKGAMAITAAGFAVVVIAFVWTVFCRYVLRAPSESSDEIAIAVYLWVVTIGASAAIGLKEHVSFDLLTSHLPPRASAFVIMAGALIAGVTLLVTLPTTIDYVAFLWREKTPVLSIPLNRLYACFAIMQAILALRLLIEAAKQGLMAFRRGEVRS